MTFKVVGKFENIMTPKKLSFSEFLVLKIISSNTTREKCGVNFHDIAKLTNLSHQTVYSVLKSLRVLRLIKKVN